jgi:hypothetical protein
VENAAGVPTVRGVTLGLPRLEHGHVRSEFGRPDRGDQPGYSCSDNHDLIGLDRRCHT